MGASNPLWARRVLFESLLGFHLDHLQVRHPEFSGSLVQERGKDRIQRVAVQHRAGASQLICLLLGQGQEVLNRKTTGRRHMLEAGPGSSLSQ